MKIRVPKNLSLLVKATIALLTLVLTIFALDLIAFLYLRHNLVAIIDNNFIITKSTVAKEFLEMGESNKSTPSDVTRQIALLYLIKKEAKKENISISKEDFNKEFDNYKQQVGEDTLKDLLKKNNLEMSKLQELFLNQMLQEKLVEGKYKKPTKEEIEDLYKQYEKEFKDQQISKEDAYKMLESNIENKNKQDALQEMQTKLLKDRVVYYIADGESLGKVYEYKPLRSLYLIISTIINR